MTNRKDINPTISIITRNVNTLNIPVKYRDRKRELKIK